MWVNLSMDGMFFMVFWLKNFEGQFILAYKHVYMVITSRKRDETGLFKKVTT